MLLGLRKIFEMNTKNFFEKLCFEKRVNINVFWKGNKTKGGRKNVL